jgi:hypothetical protein
MAIVELVPLVLRPQVETILNHPKSKKLALKTHPKWKIATYNTTNKTIEKTT